MSAIVANNAKSTGGVTGKGWQPGQSGNPSGRPQSRPLTEAYRRRLAQKLTEEEAKKFGLPAGTLVADAIALAQSEQAIKGDTPAAREIREAIEGKAPMIVMQSENIAILVDQSGKVGLQPISEAGSVPQVEG